MLILQEEVFFLNFLKTNNFSYYKPDKPLKGEYLLYFPIIIRLISYIPLEIYILSNYLLTKNIYY